MIKTTRLKKDEFFTFDKEIKRIPQFLIGGRGTGKSYAVKNYIKDMVINSNFEKRYIYVRIKARELSTHDSWFEESGILEETSYLGDNMRIIRGSPVAGNISLSYTTPLGNELKHIGYVASLEDSGSIKSAVYDSVDCIVFEEFLRRGLNEKAIMDYCFNFMELVETVRRDRKIPIFFIANTLTAYNPLLEAFTEYEINKIFTEPRRTDITDGVFSEYMQGEMYGNYNYNLQDFDYLFTLNVNGKYLSFHADRFYHRDILVTSARKTEKERLDIVNAIQRDLLYSFSTIPFSFDNDHTELHFYKNIDTVKLRIRNKLTKVLNL